MIDSNYYYLYSYLCRTPYTVPTPIEEPYAVPEPVQEPYAVPEPRKIDGVDYYA